MKFKLKLLREGHRGVYQQINTRLGSELSEDNLRIFMGNFIDAVSHGRDIKSWTRKYMANLDLDTMIHTARNSFPELASLRTSPNSTIKRKLREGWTFWWWTVLGREAVEDLIEYMVSLYKDDLNTALNSNAPHSANEALFFLDNFEEFFDSLVAVHGSRGEVENTERGSGLLGQMQDWWLGDPTGGYPIFKRAFGSVLEMLRAIPREELETKLTKGDAVQAYSSTEKGRELHRKRFDDDYMQRLKRIMAMQGIEDED